MALQHVLLMLKGETHPTRELILSRIQLVSGMLQSSGMVDQINEDELLREIESMLSIWSPKHTELSDSTGHEQWLDDKRSTLQWGFWKRYETYLEQVKKLPPNPLLKIHEMTDAVLEKLEDPDRKGQWDRRGMVVGQVQSGKTSHYTGLICKAADAGYRLIIVLAGMHNSLRSQTQFRLDEGFLGRDTQRERAFGNDSHRMGAGFIPSKLRLAANSMTSSAENGDFKKNQVGGTSLNGDPVLVVVKKNKTILENVLNWAVTVAGETDPVTGKKIVRDVPLLVIDDEADNASVNTKNSEEDVTTINGSIRKILNSFEKSAYVGYTATPFANIFIYPEAETEEYGKDLFPQSFIINLPAPSNYIGPAQVFGLEEDTDAGIEAKVALPIVKEIKDYETFIPSPHKKDLKVEQLPPSLEYAIKCFVLSCAARLARGQGIEHNSMLIHVTRFVDVQKQIEELVKHEMGSIQKRLQYGDGRSARIIDELQGIWEEDFVPTSHKVSSLVKDHSLTSVTWLQVKDCLFDAVMKIRVKQINGSANDILDYYDHKNGLSVIAVGGDKLSRGLTLEGLTVSYYLRSSRMYDTLMQMGRWFGYRPGYLDMCRLFTSKELVLWYKHIAAASEELRMDFDFMAQTGRTPMDFGLKVRTHPAGLIITGASKMRSGTVMKLSFADSLAETTVFHKRNTLVNQSNFDATVRLIVTLGSYDDYKSNNYIWHGVPAKTVTTYLRSLQGHPESRRSNPETLSEYIEKQSDIQELTEWTVVLISTQNGNKYNIGHLSVGLTERTDELKDDHNRYKIIRNHIISQRDEMIDLDDEEEAEAFRLTQESWEKKEKKGEPKSPSGQAIRSVRPVERGLLLIYPLDPEYIGSDQPFPYIGYALSFPASDNAKYIEYLVNNIYWKEEFEVE
ncbi:Z1 domain-containing protein [Brevibacillus choshinensis]|uniref:Z1 domain-containing protein n=1 Tax=Brevibacillus choshinensis TaxID=54911 RepID=UPI002E2012B0|nr:Z1 domain-containing protein [Brevibacillus choshinensis]